MNVDICNNYFALKEKINKICAVIQREPTQIRLLAVSKFHSVAAIQALYKSGHNDFAENYLQELEKKYLALIDTNIKWHFIGKLQSNKISKIVKICASIHSLDKIEHALLIAKYAKKFGKKSFLVYVEANLGSEEQKSGVPLSQVKEFVLELAKIDGINTMGLMAIPPSYFKDEAFSDKVPDEYQKLAELNNELSFNELSLGMSSDLEIALRAGSTCLRVGHSIFGPRL